MGFGAESKRMAAHGISIIDLGLGEPDFHTPQHVKNAAKKAIDENFTYYTAASGIIALKQEIVAKFQRDNCLNYTIDQILVSNGAKHSLMNIFLTLLNDGDEVIIPVPYWTSYPEMIKIAGGIPVFCDSDATFHVTADYIAAKITNKTKILILNSPNNPTGTVILEKELKKIVELCLSRNVFVISDEVYEHFCYGNTTHVSIASLGDQIYNQTITVNAVSKTYSMTGWRIGYLAGPQELVAKMAALQSHMTSNPNSIAQKAAIAALHGNISYVHKMVNAFDKRRIYLANKINAIDGISCFVPDGAFYVFAKINFDMNSYDFCMRLLKEFHVTTIPGSAFGAEGYFRLSYATNLQTIEEGCNRIAAFCRFLKKLHNSEIS